jgi:hypothetical protein
MSDLNLPTEALEGPADDQDDERLAEAEAEAGGDHRRRCACTLYAVVKPDGNLDRGHRAVSATRLSQGRYEVAFERKVRRCAYVGSVGLPGNVGSSTPGEITVVGRFGNDHAVFATTHDSSGNLSDRGFHLAVHCRP